MIRSTLYISVFLLLVTAPSCKYQKLLKSNDLDAKMAAAIKYYNEKDYYRALPLFEELAKVRRGTEIAEKISYYYAYCNYGMGYYSLAAFHFRNFCETYPNSPYLEECYYLYAYCFYLDSLPWSLDQTSTYKAIDELQLFVDLFPDSKYVADCTINIDKLRDKLEMKAYKGAKLYFHIEDYKAAITAFKTTLHDFPDIEQREEIEFLIFKASYRLGLNSVDDNREEAKKTQRLKEALIAYRSFVDTYPASVYRKEADNIYNKTLDELKKIENNNSQL
jgi:outer membrane protein assembly factor BamD